MSPQWREVVRCEEVSMRMVRTGAVVRKISAAGGYIRVPKIGYKECGDG